MLKLHVDGVVWVAMMASLVSLDFTVVSHSQDCNVRGAEAGWLVWERKINLVFFLTRN